MLQKKILMMVDDDSDDRDFFLEAVKRLGEFECLFAENGIDALDQLKDARNLPDYIFLDLNMPLMDGKKCLEELKKDPDLKDIPVIIYSTSSFQNDKIYTEKYGAAYFLTKPMNLSSLPDKIQDAIAFVKQDVDSRA